MRPSASGARRQDGCLPRTTLDADLVARIEARHALPLVQALGRDFYADEAMIRNAVRHSSSFNLIHQASMVKIDVFPVKARPYDTNALSRRRRDELCSSRRRRA